MHRTRPRPPDRAIGLAGPYTFRAHGPGQIRVGLTEALARAGPADPVRKTSSWAAPAPPLLLQRAGPRPPDMAIGPAGHYTVCGHGPRPDRTHRTHGAGRPSQKDFRLGGPRCCCTVPGRGHRTAPGPWGLRAIIQAAVTVPGGIGLRLTVAPACAGRPS